MAVLAAADILAIYSVFHMVHTSLWWKVGLKDFEQLIDIAQRHSVLRQERMHLQQLRGSCRQQHCPRWAVLLHTGRVCLQETLQKPL